MRTSLDQPGKGFYTRHHVSDITPSSELLVRIVSGEGPTIRDVNPYCSRISDGKVSAVVSRMDGSFPCSESSPLLENWALKFPSGTVDLPTSDKIPGQL